MKHVILSSLCIAAFSMTFLGSCKKEDLTPISSNNNLEPSMLQTGQHYINGWIVEVYCCGYGVEKVGHYMRSYQTSDQSWTAWFYGEGCWRPASTCLPDMDVGGSSPNIDNDNVTNSEEASMIPIPQNVSDDITNSYSTPLNDAINQGSNAVKTFFLDVLATEYDYPQELIDDITNNLVTIKLFPEGVFFVNINATQFDDCPNYNW